MDKERLNFGLGLCQKVKVNITNNSYDRLAALIVVPHGMALSI